MTYVTNVNLGKLTCAAARYATSGPSGLATGRNFRVFVLLRVVSDISHEGTWDSTGQKVKWGVFKDNQPRLLRELGVRR